MPKEYICYDCGNEQSTSVDPRVGHVRCLACESMRVGLTTIVVQSVGENWREECFPKETFPKAWEQPGWKERIK